MPFKTNIGTLGNASGLPGIPAGAGKIPQSFLNNIGRGIDSTRLTPAQGMISSVTAGGTSIDFSSVTQDFNSRLTPPPFFVEVAKVGDGALVVTINEGRVLGRSDWSQATFFPGIPDESYNIPSIGTSGLDVEITIPTRATESPRPNDPASQVKNTTGGSSSVTNSTNNTDGNTWKGTAGNWKGTADGWKGTASNWKGSPDSWKGTSGNWKGSPSYWKGSASNWVRDVSGNSATVWANHNVRTTQSNVVNGTVRTNDDK